MIHQDAGRLSSILENTQMEEGRHDCASGFNLESSPPKHQTLDAVEKQQRISQSRKMLDLSASECINSHGPAGTNAENAVHRPDKLELRCREGFRVGTLHWQLVPLINSTNSQ